MGMDLTFSTDFLVENKTVPVLIMDDAGRVLYDVNIPEPPKGMEASAYFDSLRRHEMGKNPPIRFNEVGQTIYYSESRRLRELREAMAELIEAFISETVINSASVPVLLLVSYRPALLSLQCFTPQSGPINNNLNLAQGGSGQRLHSILHGFSSCYFVLFLLIACHSSLGREQTK